ncbi:hypothetical protein PYCCODRAFT_1466307 [Trametes coccinea BRFM310]|uniref:N-acetyltransferase domain-containing protein n=1 Tax=Trametes coccinea (strain BRFM310) TaxID=1353009 RepID=A0A1Y2IT88_TRAC3|nr:hypothetical protein PYCCODRAFT_1466307 [Trametes coccinea BRFM310]
MLRAAFGDHVDKLIEVQGLVTAPAKQGQGYGTALMEFANALADAQDRGVYIFTTDAYRFYETVGYTLVEEDVLGVDNPKWKGDPVHIRIVDDFTAIPRHAPDEDASTPLLRPAIVEPLRYADIPKAARLTQRAFDPNTLDRYMRAADTAPARELRQRITLFIDFTDHIMCDQAWTINHGEAILTIGLPKQKGRLFMLFLPIIKRFYTEELAKRKAEYRQKVAAMLEAAFGDSVDELIEVQSLATAREKQGSGYGTALMHHANALADSQNRGVYMITSDAHKFYETVGYSIVQEATMGENNPAWDGEPVRIRLMYRAPKSKRGEGMASHAASDVSGNPQDAPQPAGLNQRKPSTLKRL